MVLYERPGKRRLKILDCEREKKCAFSNFLNCWRELVPINRGKAGDGAFLVTREQTAYPPLSPGGLGCIIVQASRIAT